VEALPTFDGLLVSVAVGEVSDDPPYRPAYLHEPIELVG
jgi:hypothetical protein